METNNIDMEELMKMKELVDMEKYEKDNEKSGINTINIHTVVRLIYILRMFIYL